MPGKVGVKIKAGRNLPVMDRSSDTTDAYVEIKLGNVTQKTDVCRKSLNPQWNTDWFRFEVDDAELQDEPLQIRLMDHDTYSANDAIGKVNISLNPLCLDTSGQAAHGKGTVLSGWIPVFDTMHGIRGEVNIIVKVDLFSDVNKFRQSSCGIPFFHSQCIPHGYRAQIIHGFVEELVVNDDPEYQWIDKIRTPRASNEARQMVFLRLSGQVQRKMGLKAINMGANAVIGYTQCFDLEGDVGVVARGIGTAVTLIKDTSGSSQVAATDNALIEERTLKYLDFLCGAGVDVELSRLPKYELQIERANSVISFGLKANSNTEINFNEVMQKLIQQEDERGEKPARKLKHHVRRFTQSSRNILNEKCNALMRKLGDSSDHSSRSWSSLYNSVSGINTKETASSTQSSRIDVRKQHKTKPKVIFKQNSFTKNLHHIVRSISDDSAMTHSAEGKLNVPHTVDITGYQDSTRSSPNICSEEQKLRLAAVQTMIEEASGSDDSHFMFGQFSEHEPHLYQNQDESGNIQSSSSTTVSLSISGSSISEDSTFEYCAWKLKDWTESQNENETKGKSPKKLRKIYSINENETDNEQTYAEANLLEHETFTDKVQYVEQQERDKEKAEHDTEPAIIVPTPKSTNIRRSPPKSLTLKSLEPIEKNDFYYSQPNLISDENQTNTLELPLPNLTHSHSLNALMPDTNTNSAADTNVNVVIAASEDCTNIKATAADTLNPPNPPSTAIKSLAEFKYPTLNICPSTPTPSESDNSQFSPNEPRFVANALSATQIVASSICSPSILETSASPPKTSVHVTYPQSNSSLTFSDCLPKTHKNKTTDTSNRTNHGIINPSLLVPSSTYTTLPLSITKHRHQHRSLNDINPALGNIVGGDGLTDSPSMKRGSPAACAAVVAAGSGPVLGSRTKLSPSPSKTGLNINTQSQSDSVSSTTTSTATTMVAKDMNEMCRRSSDSDLSVTPKGNSFCVASERLVAATAMMRLSQPIPGKNVNTDNLDMLEYPFLTLIKYPPGFILHLGATVAARSVKLLERVDNPDEPEVRDSWWTELRMEIRSHARALGCNVVLGYSESTTISDDVCVLSATGTAAVINMAYNRSVSQNDIFTMTKPPGSNIMTASLEERDMIKELRNGVFNDISAKENMSSSYGAAQSGLGSAGKRTGLPTALNMLRNSCTMCHVPYSLTLVPFNVKMKKCAICRKGRVPDVLLATLEVPEFLQITGRSCFMQAQVVRAKKDLRSELNAKEISDGLPFLEYELHRVLINKLKAKGMNAIFGLKTQVSIGERMIALIATGTALFLTALPVPQVPKIVAGNTWTDKQKLNELQKKLQETFDRNQEIYQLKCIDPDIAPPGSGGGGLDKQSDTDDSDDEVIEIDLNCGNKDTCVLEVDDIEDLEIISLLMEPYPPEGFHVVNTQMVPGMVDLEAVKNLQMFTQIWRAKLEVGNNINGFPKHFQRLLQTIYFKLRTMIPCAICDLRFRLDLPESDNIQLLVTGMALGLGDANKFKYRRKVANATTNGVNNEVAPPPTNVSNVNLLTMESNGIQGHKRTLQEEDYIFPLDDDCHMMVDTPTPTSNIPPFGAKVMKLRKTSPSRTATKTNATQLNRYFPLRDRYGVDITPLSFIPGGKVEKYLGNLNFFFIRESTSIRENGGISGFVHGFITELLAVVRAHIAALGGNAMMSFYMSELILVDSQHKNQGQCLISVGGDAVYVSYYADD